jgi:hypothetical protein
VSTPRIVLNRRRLATLVVAAIAFPVVAGPADAASTHRRSKSKRAKVTKVAPKRVAVAKPAAVPAPASAAVPAAASAPIATPTVTSVISIGGYVFYNLTYVEAVEAYFAAVAAAPAGYSPPPVTSVSVDVSVGN